jgi:hypothetical protein
MAGGNLKFKPVEELSNRIAELCSNIQDRKNAVEAAIRNGIQTKAHPAKLPVNIYGTQGEWEEYSTPSRDARLKVAFASLRTELARFVQLFDQRSSRVEYQPVQSAYSQNCAAQDVRCFFVASLKTAYAEAVNKPECQFEYKRTNGISQTLNYSDVVARLFLLSFSLYRTSVRMPATGEGTSLSTLSVAISKTASSNSIRSPGFFSQRKMVASMILSPILGITRSVRAITTGFIKFSRKRKGTSFYSE